MAKANQEKWFADALISNSQGYRSFEAMAFAGPRAAMQSGQVLLIDGALPPAAGTNARLVLLQSVPTLAAGENFPALVLARDAEVNDAYMIFTPAVGGGITTAINSLRDNSNIIVRPGVLAQSIVPAAAEAPPPAGEPGTNGGPSPPEAEAA